jgi:hypothetical protein
MCWVVNGPEGTDSETEIVTLGKTRMGGHIDWRRVSG